MGSEDERARTYVDYDEAGRVDGITAPDGGVVSYTYDGPFPMSETWSGTVSGSVARTYDSDLRVATHTVMGSTVAYQYDADGLLTSAGGLSIGRDAQTGRIGTTSLGLVGTSQGYTSYGELKTYDATANGSNVYAYTLERDDAGRITSKTETVEGTTTTWGYAYDEAGRLWTVTRDGIGVATYEYDPNGNRLFRTAGGVTQSATYDDQDRLLADGAATYTYRPTGALESKTVGTQTTTYDYDAFGNLLAAALPDGRQIEYVVDGLNRRIGKAVNGVLVEGFLYDGQLRPVAWMDGAGQVRARFVYGLHVNVPEYMVTADGTKYRFVTDHLGSPRLVVNAATGAVVQRVDYDEWGVVLSDTNPGFQPFGFAGGLYDRDTGLLRFGSRDYQPSIGRWMTKDPLGLDGGLNVYAYALGDPVQFVDPTGKTAASNITFFVQWLFGIGDRYRVYGPNDDESDEMAASPGAEKLRDAFYRNGCRTTTGQSYGTVKAGFETGPVPGNDWSSTALQVGGWAGASSTNNGNGTVTFVIPNVAGFKSFAYHSFPDIPNPAGPMSNIYQIFVWGESIDAARCGCP